MLFNSHTTSPPSRTSLGLSYPGHPFSLSRNVAWVEGEGFRLSSDISDTRQPVQSCVGMGKGAYTCSPRVRLTVHVLWMLCMCPVCSSHLGHARVPLQLLQRSGQSRGYTHCSSLRGLFFSLFLLCTLLNHLLLEGWEVEPTPTLAGCHCPAEGSQLLGSPSLLGPAPALLHPLPKILLLPQAAPFSCSPCLCLATPFETQPFTFPESLCPPGTQAARQRACPDGLISLTSSRIFIQVS